MTPVKPNNQKGTDSNYVTNMSSRLTMLTVITQLKVNSASSPPQSSVPGPCLGNIQCSQHTRAHVESDYPCSNNFVNCWIFPSYDNSPRHPISVREVSLSQSEASICLIDQSEGPGCNIHVRAVTKGCYHRSLDPPGRGLHGLRQEENIGNRF